MRIEIICHSALSVRSYIAKTENKITYYICGAAFKVQNESGAVLLESVYKHILAYELEKEGFIVKKQVPVPVIYENHTFDIGFRLDLLVKDKVMVEIKSIEILAPVHYKQLLNYLRISNRKLLGLLINLSFKTLDEKSIVRIVKWTLNKKYLRNLQNLYDIKCYSYPMFSVLYKV